MSTRPPDVAKLAAKRKTKGLLRALHHHDSTIRRRAAEALGTLGDQRAVEPLIAALADRSGPVTVEAARALGRLGDRRATEPLLAALRKPEPQTHGGWNGDRRVASAEALGSIGDPRSVDALVACLDEDSAVRTRALAALDELDWQPEGPAAEVSYCVARQDHQRCMDLDGAAVQPLLGVLGRRAPRDRRFAAEVLAEIGGAQAVDPLIEALGRAHEPGLRSTIIDALGEIGDARAVEPLVECLDRTPAAAAEALERVGPPAIELLVTSLGDKRRRAAAAEILDHLGWQASSTRDHVAYRIAKNDVDGCIEIGPDAVPPLLSVLERGSGRDTTFAAEVLAEIGGAEALGTLIAAGTGPAAAAALDEIAIRLVAGGWSIDDRRLAPVLEKIVSRTVEPDRRTRGVDDDYKHFDDGWGADGRNDLATATVVGERLAASWVSGGAAERLGDLDPDPHTEGLLHCLTVDLDWHTKGLIAALLVDHGMRPGEPRLQPTVEELTAWATRQDEDEEIEPMVVESRRYEHQRLAAQRLLDRLT